MAVRVNIDIDVSSAGVEDLYLTRGLLKLIDQGFQDDGLDTPEWVTDKMGAVSTEITNRNRGELLRRLKAAKARRENYKTREEKAGALDKEIQDLEKRLA